MSYERELQVAVQAVADAAALCRDVQAQITPATLEKKDRSPVTVADFGSQALICRALAAAFPGDPVIAEEDSAELRRADRADMLAKVVQHVAQLVPSATAAAVCEWIDHGGHKDSCERFWTLDPIDGTKGFLRGEQYAVALALIVNGRPEVAVLACPNLPLHPASDRGVAQPSGSSSIGALFQAVRGRGARAGALDRSARGAACDAGMSPIRVSPNTDLSAARFAESVESGHSSHGDSEQVAARLGIRAQPVRMDSQVKYATVARGDAEMYLRLPTRKDYFEKIWDHAAGTLVVTEAGGTVTDIAGAPLDFTRGAELRANQGILVSNGVHHARLVEAVRAVLGG